MAAAALDDIDPGSPVATVLQLQAQCGRRGFLPGVGGAVEESQLGAVLCGQLQAAQAREADTLGPGQYNPATAVAQGLFAGPQGFFLTAGAHQEQALQ